MSTDMLRRLTNRRYIIIFLLLSSAKQFSFEMAAEIG